MGSNSRLVNMMNQSQIQGSNSHLHTNYSVMSEDNQESIAVLWGTNFDVKEVEVKIRKFILTYRVSLALTYFVLLGERRYAHRGGRVPDPLYEEIEAGEGDRSVLCERQR